MFATYRNFRIVLSFKKHIITNITKDKNEGEFFLTVDHFVLGGVGSTPREYDGYYKGEGGGLQPIQPISCNDYRGTFTFDECTALYGSPNHSNLFINFSDTYYSDIVPTPKRVYVYFHVINDKNEICSHKFVVNSSDTEAESVNILSSNFYIWNRPSWRIYLGGLPTPPEWLAPKGTGTIDWSKYLKSLTVRDKNGNLKKVYDGTEPETVNQTTTLSLEYGDTITIGHGWILGLESNNHIIVDKNADNTMITVKAVTDNFTLRVTYSDSGGGAN